MCDIIQQIKQIGVYKIMNYEQNIRDLREDREYKQKDIAKILNISQQYYSEYEKGNRELPTRHLRTLCIFYNVSADYILGLPQGLEYPKR